MASDQIRIALAALEIPASLEEGVEKIKASIANAAAEKAAIICFPETYLPGLRGQNLPLPEPDQAAMEAALEEVRLCAKGNKIAVLLPMEWQTELGWHNLVQVISGEGEVLGYQAKNQFPTVEEKYYVSDGKRRVFTIGDLTFGIAICHEGWRYPETVRWAAVRGAQVVFHPHFAGSNQKGELIQEWGLLSSPYYEKAMIARSVENSIYFASVNCTFKYPHSATSLISPWGELVAHAPYGKEHLLIEEIDLSEATRYFAKRFKPDRYPD